MSIMKTGLYFILFCFHLILFKGSKGSSVLHYVDGHTDWLTAPTDKHINMHNCTYTHTCTLLHTHARSVREYLEYLYLKYVSRIQYMYFVFVFQIHCSRSILYLYFKYICQIICIWKYFNEIQKCYSKLP